MSTFSVCNRWVRHLGRRYDTNILFHWKMRRAVSTSLFHLLLFMLFTTICTCSVCTYMDVIALKKIDLMHNIYIPLFREENIALDIHPDTTTMSCSSITISTVDVGKDS